MIPPDVHFVWLGSPLPSWAAENIRRFVDINPEFAVELHGDECLIPEWRGAYAAQDGKYRWSNRSDLVRACILRDRGGWYFDTDFIFLRPMRELYAEFAGFPKGAFLTRHKGEIDLVANGVIGVEADCPFMDVLWEAMNDRVLRVKGTDWGGYGPALYTRLARGPAAAMVDVAETPLFYPFPDLVPESRAAAKEIVGSDYDPEVVARLTGRAFAMHFSMQGDLDL